MPEFMEQRHDIVVRELRRPLVRRRHRIAHQVGHRQDGAPAERLATDTVVHPGAAALVRPCIGIEVERGDRRIGGRLHLEVANIRVPHRHPGAFADAHIEQFLRHLEQALEYPRQRQVVAQLLLRDRVAALLHALGIEGHIPGVELAAGELLEFGEFRRPRRLGGAYQLAQEADHLGYRARHAVGERIVRVAAEIHQLRGLVPQPQDVVHHRGVVEIAGAGPLIGGAGRPGLVEHAPQRFGLTVGHHGDVAGLIQAEQPALDALVLGPLCAPARRWHR